VVPAPPISHLAHRLLHTSNTVFLKCVLPLLVFDPPHAAKSWRRAWLSEAFFETKSDKELLKFQCENLRLRNLAMLSVEQ